MLSRTTERFRSQFAELPKPIQIKAASAYALWSSNPEHPSLRFKKVSYVVANPSAYAYLDPLRPTLSALPARVAAAATGYLAPTPATPPDAC